MTFPCHQDFLARQRVGVPQAVLSPSGSAPGPARDALRRRPTRQPFSKAIGTLISALVIIVMFADAVAQILALPAMRATTERSGFPFVLSPLLGTITMTCVILYATPRTAILGAILLTAFLGGAICMHLRLGEIGSPPQIVCIALGAMTWAGLWLRDGRVRAVLPLRS